MVEVFPELSENILKFPTLTSLTPIGAIEPFKKFGETMTIEMTVALEAITSVLAPFRAGDRPTFTMPGSDPDRIPQLAVFIRFEYEND